MVTRWLLGVFILCWANISLAQTCPAGAGFYVQSVTPYPVCVSDINCEARCADDNCIGVNDSFSVYLTGNSCSSGSEDPSPVEPSLYTCSFGGQTYYTAADCIRASYRDTILDIHDISNAVAEGGNIYTGFYDLSNALVNGFDSIRETASDVQRELQYRLSKVESSSLGEDEINEMNSKISQASIKASNAVYEVDGIRGAHSDLAENYYDYKWSSLNRFSDLESRMNVEYYQLLEHSNSINSAVKSDLDDLKDLSNSYFDWVDEIGLGFYDLSYDVEAQSESIGQINDTLSDYDNRINSAAQYAYNAVSQDQFNGRASSLEQYITYVSNSLNTLSGSIDERFSSNDLALSELRASIESLDSGSGSGSGDGSGFDDSRIVSAIQSNTVNTVEGLNRIDDSLNNAEIPELPGQSSVLPEQVVDFSNFEQYIKTDYFGGGSGSCPPDYSISIPGFSDFTITYQPFCDFALLVRPLIILLAWLGFILSLRNLRA